MSPAYRPPRATTETDPVNDGEPVRKRVPWRPIAACVGVAWSVILGDIALRPNGWGFAPYVWTIFDWMPVLLLAAFLWARSRTPVPIGAWAALLAAEVILVLPVLVFAWFGQVLVAEQVSPGGFHVARSYAAECDLVCHGKLFTAMRGSPLEALADERNGKVPGEIQWSPDGATATLTGTDVQHVLRGPACQPSRFFTRPVWYLLACTGKAP